MKGMADEENAVLSEEDLENVLNAKRKECESLAEADAAVGTEPAMCSTVWDGIMCWPAAGAKQLSSQGCPRYFPGLDHTANATKECTENGTWFVSEETHEEWTNYSQCYVGGETVIMVPVPPVDAPLFQEYIPTLKRMSHVGYGVSLSTLAVAFFVLVTLRKLHCSRNMLHLHLFMSFIMKAVITFVKESLFEQGIGLHSDFIVQNGTSYFVEKMNSNWECKALTTVWQYFIMANYSWVLMEGLYIHNLIIFALFSDNGSIAFYVILGWGLPAVFVALWVCAKIKLENELCWTTKTDSKNFLIIRIPTIVSILLSFILFLNMVRLLLIKVRSTVQEETRRYRKWAKSTLILIPLFGVHYALFHGMSYSRGVNERVELVWLFCDQFFASFQGFFVAVLFCFLNAEIQSEVKRKWRHLDLYDYGCRCCCGGAEDINRISRFPCLQRIREAWRPNRDRKASERADATEFMTNDSVIPMIIVEKDKMARARDGVRDEEADGVAVQRGTTSDEASSVDVIA